MAISVSCVKPDIPVLGGLGGRGAGGEEWVDGKASRGKRVRVGVGFGVGGSRPDGGSKKRKTGS